MSISRKILDNAVNASITGASRVVALFTGVERDAVALPLQYRWLDFIGPSPDVWNGPIFIHIPKAAGSSIHSSGAKWTKGHKPLSFYQRHKPSGRVMPMTFAVVREPLARYFSAFNYLHAGGLTAQDRRWSRQNIPADADANSFIEFLNADPQLMRQMHFRPQIELIVDAHGKIGVDRLLRFESLERDWPEFAREAGLNPVLRHVNVAPNNRPKTEPTQRCRDLIAELYAKDFQAFGYPLPA